MSEQVRPYWSIAPRLRTTEWIVILTTALAVSCRQHLPANARCLRISPMLPVIELMVKDHQIAVEVAADKITRQRGLMFRSSLAPDSGMLFVFESDEPRSFWMYNTYLPLSVAFVDSAGTIVNIVEMAPNDTTIRYLSERPARYALEMNSGWFASHSIKPGDTIKGLPSLALKLDRICSTSEQK